MIWYQLGTGCRLNENWLVFARAAYEKANGGVALRLSPADGQKSLGIGGSYTMDAMKITAGLEYMLFGNAIDASNRGVQGQ